MLRFVPRAARALDERAAAALQPYDGVTARLLYARGIDTAAEAERFLHPSLAQLHDPMRMHGMARAVELLAQAREERWPTVVYGDYDVDGICAASLLTLALRRYGVDAQPYTPLRAEGYGLNEAAVRALSQHCRLLVTVDLGITNHAEVRLAQSLGMRVIVTDHHGLSLEQSPADAVMNPLLGDYPFRKLCGTGVALKLAQALLGLDACEEYLDLAALATVADVVPLRDENRVLVALGLPAIASRRRPGMRALLRVSGDPETIDSDTLGFRLGPRLNAAGRLDDAGKGVRLMMTDDPREAERLAEELDALNTERKTTEQRLVRAAMEAAQGHDFLRERALIVRGEDWHMGVIGLAAGRLCTRYFCPTCVLSEHECVMHGSLRSIPGVNIHRCLQQCDDLLMRYGGHEQAAGVTLESANYEAFCARLQGVVAQCEESCFIPVQEYDAELALEACTPERLHELEQLAPFGCGNPAPLFLGRELRVEERRAVGADGSHLKLTLRQGGRMMGGIAFGMGGQANHLPDSVDAVYRLTRNTFRGNVSQQLEIQALRPVMKARQRALRDAAPGEDAAGLLAFLLDAFAKPAGKRDGKAELIQEVDFSALETALRVQERGHLLVAHTAASALRALALGEMDVCGNAPEDPRGFLTLVTRPLLSRAGGCWRCVWLLDGEACPGEAARWRDALGAEVRVLPRTQALRDAARALDAGDAAYRLLYKAMRAGVGRTLGQLATSAGMTENQARVGLNAFAQLGLCRLSEEPLRYMLLESRRCSLGDSPLLGALRMLGGTKD